MQGTGMKRGSDVGENDDRGNDAAGRVMDGETGRDGRGSEKKQGILIGGDPLTYYENLNTRTITKMFGQR